MIETPGNYPARAVDAVWSESKDGTPVINIDFEIQNDTRDHIVWRGSFVSDASTDRSIAGMRAAGFLGVDMADLASLKRENTPQVQLVVDWNEYNGSRTLQVKFINTGGALGGAKAYEMPVDKQKAFAASMKAKLASFGSTPRPRPAAVPRQTMAATGTDGGAPYDGDDDIPF